MAAAIAYALWAGRERANAYYALMLFLMGAIVCVFSAQDLILFYVAFEAMMIPLYLLIGVWGGERRIAATFKFVAYTMAGSLLMLVSIVVYGLSHGFDLTTAATELQRLALPRLRGRLRRQGAALPAARLAAGRLPRVAAGGRRGALGPRLEGGRLRLPAHRPDQVPRRRVARPARRCPPGALGGRARLRLAARLPGARLPRRRRLLEPGPDEPDRARPVLGERARAERLGAADGQPRPDLDRALPARRGDREPRRRPASSGASAAWPAGARSWPA